MSLRRIVVWVVADRTSIAGFGAVTVMLSLTDAGIAVIVTVVIVPETTLSVTSGDVTCFPIAATRYIPIGTAAKRNTPCESVFDDRVRDQINTVFDARHPTDALAGLSGRATEFVAIVAQAMRSQSLEHAPLVIFALAATVLVLFMLRT